MANIHWPSLLAFWPETTPGTPPADASAWGTNGLPIRHDHESLDVSGFQQTPIEDTRNQTIGFGLERKQRGLKNGTFPFTAHLHGCEAIPSVDTQVSQTRVSRLLQHALGGEHRSNNVVLAGSHTATSVQVTANTNVVAGMLVNVEDLGAANQANIRRVTAVSGSGPYTLTLDEALPFTPVDGDKLYPVITNHIDETVIADAVGQTNTFSWFIRKGLTALGNELWEASGSKAGLQTITVGRDDLLRAAFEVMFAKYQGPNELSLPTFANSEEGMAGTVVGPATQVFLQDYETTTQNSVKVAEFSVEVGVPVTRVETTTEAVDGMQGTATYAFAQAETLIRLNLVGLTADFWNDWDNDTFKVLRWSTRRTAGNNMALVFPRCEVVETPQRGQANDVSSTQLVLRAHPDLSSVGSTALARSKILIGHA